MKKKLLVIREIKFAKKEFVGERIYKWFVTEEIYEIKFVGSRTCIPKKIVIY